MLFGIFPILIILAIFPRVKEKLLDIKFIDLERASGGQVLSDPKNVLK